EPRPFCSGLTVRAGRHSGERRSRMDGRIRAAGRAVHQKRRLAAVAAGMALRALTAPASGDPRIKTAGENDATGDVFKMYAPFKQAFGFVPNEYEAMSQDLSLFRVHASFTHALIDSTRHLTPQEKAMIGVEVGTALSSDYVKQLESW